MIDAEPAANRMAHLLPLITDDQLTARTPCADYRLGDLLDHVRTLTKAFTVAAAKQTDSSSGGPPTAGASNLGAGWRERIAEQLTELVAAWRDPAAWQGMTKVGGLDLPGEVTGAVMLNELTVHGWDVARAIGVPYESDEATLRACEGFVSAVAGQEGGPFGAVVDVPADAPLLDRIIGACGRDPAWR